MTDAERYKLYFGPYAAPRCRIGSVRMCEVRGELVVCGLTDARIPWPIGKRRMARSLVITGGLAKALRCESNLAITYWWGVGAKTIAKWRRALAVPPINEGTRRLLQLYYPEKITPEVFDRAIRAANTPEVNARKNVDKIGKPRPQSVIDAMRRAKIGVKPSAEARARMSQAQKHRGVIPPAAKGPPWTAEEDASLGTMPDNELAGRIARSANAVRQRRMKKGIPRFRG